MNKTQYIKCVIKVEERQMPPKNIHSQEAINLGYSFTDGA